MAPVRPPPWRSTPATPCGRPRSGWSRREPAVSPSPVDPAARVDGRDAADGATAIRAPSSTCWPSTSAPEAPRWPWSRPAVGSWPTPPSRWPSTCSTGAEPNRTRPSGGRPSWPPRPGPWPRPRCRPTPSSGWAAPRSGRARWRWATDGEPLMPAVIWMDSRGNKAIRKVAGGPVNVLGYDPRKIVRWVQVTGGAPGLSGKDPVAHILFIRDEYPDVYRATATFLEPCDYLNLKLTGVTSASFDSIASPLGDRQPDHRPGRVRRAPAGVDRSGPGQAARPGASGHHHGHPAGRPRRRTGGAGRTAGGGGLGGRALGGVRIRGGGGLRCPPLHRHLLVDLRPRPLQEDRAHVQRGLHPGRPTRPLSHRRRARDGRGLSDLPPGQPGLRRGLRVHERHGRHRWSRAADGCCSPRGSTASGRRWTTTPSGAGSTTSRWPPPVPRWSGPSSRAWPSTRGGCSRRWRSSPAGGSTRWPSSEAGPTRTSGPRSMPMCWVARSARWPTRCWPTCGVPP